MSAHFDRVEGWETRSVAGMGDVHDLAVEEFSGAIRGGDDVWVFLLNGRIVGEFGGRVEDVDGGTAYVAPDPALPLLFSMQEQGGETQATYYTNETSLSEADRTLSDANFTGYVELSENVLSGDYYVVYYGGRSMSAAFVGQSEELLAGDDAFERADDEVGIFEVVSVDVEVRDVPEPDGSAAGTTVDETVEEVGTDDGTSEASDAAAPDADDDGDAPAEVAPTEPTDDADGTEPTVEAADDATASWPRTAQPADGGEEADDDEETRPTSADAEPGRVDADADRGDADAGEIDAGAEEVAARRSRMRAEPGETAHAGDDDVFSREAEWRERTTIPALDPDESEPDGNAADGDAADGGAAPRRRVDAASAPTERPEPDTGAGPDDGSEDAPDAGDALRDRLQEREHELNVLRERAAEIAEERDALVEECEELREERGRLADRIDRLKEELAEARAAAATGGAADERDDAGETGPSLSPSAALEGTNLFVRYASQSDPTLEDAHDGADAEAVHANLRLVSHTGFDADAATVAGEPYAAFLEETLEYRFVDWLVRDLLHEIRETGGRSAVADLYDALPEIDRAELRGEVTVSPDGEDGEVERRAFDVVCRDRMGTPLLVANLNASRDPVTGEMMDDLLDAAATVAESTDDLAAGLCVTESFFKPDALETATEATKGGFLSRDSRRSFVKLSRKRGFHLCLVEAREDSFYVNVPEL